MKKINFLPPQVRSIEETPTLEQAREYFLKAPSDKLLILITGIMAVVYFAFLTFWLPKGNSVLFYLLVAGEVFHLWQITCYLYTVWQPNFFVTRTASYLPPVDVYITVTGEPREVVAETARAALAMQYPHFNVYLLNDGYVAGKKNWEEIVSLAKQLGIFCITRTKPGGAKAGNINNALAHSEADFIAIFDADQVPHADFLEVMLSYLRPTKVAFVQSPQFYKNFNVNEVTRGAWEQQELFFGPICKGKNRLNSTFMCGTNMAVRKSALLAVGGMCETNIAEDFLTSLFIHEHGFTSVYIPEVLAEGLAPEDFYSYYKQQFRWARGSLEVLFRYNPLFRRGLSFKQKIQYLFSASYYFSGMVVLMNALLPLIFFFTGLVPLNVSTMGLAAIFLPYIFFTIWILQLTSNRAYTFRAVAFSMSSWTIHLQALWAVLINQKSSFGVTAKQRLQGNFIYLTIPHIIYLLVALVAIGISILRGGLTAAFMSNLSWTLFNVSVFTVFISAALPRKNQGFSSFNEPDKKLPPFQHTTMSLVPSRTENSRSYTKPSY